MTEVRAMFWPLIASRVKMVDRDRCEQVPRRLFEYVRCSAASDCGRSLGSMCAMYTASALGLWLA